MSENKTEIKEGDVVELKSGGPKMTVEYKDGSLCWCVWYENMEMKTKSFYPHSLKKSPV